MIAATLPAISVHMNVANTRLNDILAPTANASPAATPSPMQIDRQLRCKCSLAMMFTHFTFSYAALAELRKAISCCGQTHTRNYAAALILVSFVYCYEVYLPQRHRMY